MTSPDDPADARDAPVRNDGALPAGWLVALATALGYALVGWVALALAEPPGYASPLYPSAGLALAASLVYGRAALPGVALGSFAVNLMLATLRFPDQRPDLLLPALIALGATLQAGVGTLLVRRFVAQPLALIAPRDILRAGLLGACVACLVSPSLATAALMATGALGPGQWLVNWATWWVGDTLGVLIGAPLVLTLIGRPRADWEPRRLTLGLPLLAATALLAAALLEVERRDTQRLQATFERDADRLASATESSLALPLAALQAVHSAALVRGELDEAGLRLASRWWLEQSRPLVATGYSVAVARADVPAFEAAARAEGLTGYRVFEREGAADTTTDAEVVALRQIEPRAPNAGALGVNTLSIPAARAAVLAARRSGQPAATAGFRLTQSATDETGLVLYQALYDEATGVPATEAEREARFRGLVFVSVRPAALLAQLTPPRDYRRWCLVDLAPGVPRPRLAGAPGCETAPAAASGVLTAQRRVAFGGRTLELRVQAPLREVPGQQRESAWLLSLAGLSAAALLGALLLVVTGHTRRTQRAVAAGTSALRQQVRERSAAQAALADSEARLRSILDHVPIGVMIMDPDGRLIEVNPRLCEMLGRSAEVLRRMSITDISHPDEWQDNIRQRRELMRGEITLAQRQMRASTGDGRWLWVRTGVSVLRNPAGRVVRMVAVVEDITEHLRLEASERALQQAQASSRAKSEFVSRMSHELRTPLNAMIGFAQLLGLDRSPGLTPQQQEWTQQIQRAGWHLLEMINETLDLARIEAGAVQLTLQPVAVAPLLAACRAMVSSSAAQRGIVFQDSPGAEPGVAVMADGTRLKQIVTNLLSNAVKYNRSGGQVVLGVAAQADGTVEISVRDTGMGMTAEQLEGLFQPYNRLGREGSGIEGTGIGLVISRRLAELMGGRLEVRSQAGEGSVFTLTLRRAAPLPAAPDEPAVTEPPPYQLRRVHYIEDNETNVEVMRGILAQRPQVVLDVTTMGLDGVSAVRRQRPDLVLLDMQLPDISGLELLRHLKRDEAVAGIPVIVVSADATPERMREALTLGALHYITKPVDIARFLRVLDEVLDAQESRWGM